jgi:hypothetical protein
VPVLVGYSSGATLAYAALVQAPANTFRSAVSLGSVRTSRCAAVLQGTRLGVAAHADGKGVRSRPRPSWPRPDRAAGDVGKVCDPKQTADFVRASAAASW